MTQSVVMTTSWDDGHPLDLRVADLLAKHGLTGTFYVPLETSFPVVTREQIRELAHEFEVGAHTVHHIELTTVRDSVARFEIVESKRRLEEITGKRSAMFCFPKGRFYKKHLGMIRESGLQGARTVELLSLEKPLNVEGVALMSTTIQAHSHDVSDYARNCVRRGRAQNLLHLLRAGGRNNWETVATGLLRKGCERGGIFHLWGHSWEVDAFGQWETLERVLRLMSQLAKRGSCVTNAEICRYAS